MHVVTKSGKKLKAAEHMWTNAAAAYGRERVIFKKKKTNRTFTLRKAYTAYVNEIYDEEKKCVHYALAEFAPRVFIY